MPETVQQLLAERKNSDAPAVAHGDRIWTWREHLAEAEAEAAALITLADSTRPLHVGALLGNSPAMLRAMAAAGSPRCSCTIPAFARRSAACPSQSALRTIRKAARAA